MKKQVQIKPGKLPSAAGFVLGAAFTLFGIFVAIPIFGAFGILWTMIAALITILNAKNAFSQKGVATHVLEIDEDDMPALDAESRLKQLESLREQGLISVEEYEAKRAKILEEL